VPKAAHAASTQGGSLAARNRLHKPLQGTDALVFYVVAIPAEELQVVRVIRDAPVAPVSLIERHDVVHFLARLDAPLSQAFLAQPVGPLDDQLPHSLPFGRFVHSPPWSSHRATTPTPHQGRGREVRRPRPCGVGGGRDFVAGAQRASPFGTAPPVCSYAPIRQK